MRRKDRPLVHLSSPSCTGSSAASGVQVVGTAFLFVSPPVGLGAFLCRTFLWSVWQVVEGAPQAGFSESMSQAAIWSRESLWKPGQKVGRVCFQGNSSCKGRAGSIGDQGSFRVSSGRRVSLLASQTSARCHTCHQNIPNIVMTYTLAVAGCVHDLVSSFWRLFCDYQSVF